MAGYKLMEDILNNYVTDQYIIVDAGESKWLPASYRLSEGNSDLLPNIFTTKYVEAAASLGGMIETRSAHRNQVCYLML